MNTNESQAAFDAIRRLEAEVEAAEANFQPHLSRLGTYRLELAELYKAEEQFHENIRGIQSRLDRVIRSAGLDLEAATDKLKLSDSANGGGF